jgi:hypothetical protein
LSLDTLVAHDAAREALQLVFTTLPLGRALVRYLALFRPKAQELTFARVARLMAELQPDIKAERIIRNGVVYPAPIEAWVYAIEQTIAARDDGRLKTPLKSHGWLYEVIANWRPPVAQVLSVEPAGGQGAQKSQTRGGLEVLEAMKHGG